MIEFVFAFVVLFSDGTKLDVRYTSADEADCRSVGPSVAQYIASGAGPGVDIKVTRKCEKGA